MNFLENEIVWIVSFPRIHNYNNKNSDDVVATRVNTEIQFKIEINLISSSFCTWTTSCQCALSSGCSRCVFFRFNCWRQATALLHIQPTTHRQSKGIKRFNLFHRTIEHFENGFGVTRLYVSRLNFDFFITSNHKSFCPIHNYFYDSTLFHATTRILLFI